MLATLGSLISLVPYFATISLLYAAALVVYRLYFHPLAHIPGPRLAITTYLYEWYYDLYLSGQYTFQLKALHKKFGKTPNAGTSAGLTIDARARHPYQSR